MKCSTHLKGSGNKNPRQDRVRIPKENTKSMMRAFLQMSIANNYITDMHKASTVRNGQPEASAMVVFFLLLLHTTEKEVGNCHCFLLCCFPEPRAHRLPPQKPDSIVMCSIIHSSTAPHNAIQTQHITLPTNPLLVTHHDKSLLLPTQWWQSHRKTISMSLLVLQSIPKCCGRNTRGKLARKNL
jgi:hypothetical protein